MVISMEAEDKLPRHFHAFVWFTCHHQLITTSNKCVRDNIRTMPCSCTSVFLTSGSGQGFGLGGNVLAIAAVGVVAAAAADRR